MPNVNNSSFSTVFISKDTVFIQLTVDSLSVSETEGLTVDSDLYLELFSSDRSLLASGIGIMHFTRTLHPPAGAVTLVVMLTRPDSQFLLRPTLEGSLIFVLCTIIFNNLAEERTYPKYWL